MSAFGIQSLVPCHAHPLIGTDANLAHIGSGGAWICDYCSGKFEGRLGILAAGDILFLLVNQTFFFSKAGL